LFHKLEVAHLAFEPAIFAHYDMFLVVSRAPLICIPAQKIQQTLSLTSHGRMIQATLDIDDQLRDLKTRYAESEKDRTIRLANAQALEKLLAESEHDRTARLANLQAMEKLLAKSEHDRTQCLGTIETQHATLEFIRTEAAVTQTALACLDHSFLFRLLRRLGQWPWLTQSIEPPTKPSQCGIKPLRRVVVDLTPVLPDGENGGAKLLAMELIRHLSQLTPACEWILLTSEKGFADLAPLDAINVRRVRVNANVRLLDGKHSRLARRQSVVQELAADLLFCPFTTARFFDPQVPMVTIVYDLQHRTYPAFFSSAECAHRDREFQEICRLAAHLVCISENTRQAVLQHGQIDPPRVSTIHIGLYRRLAALPADDTAEVLCRLSLKAGQFLLYPANYWPHKNHEMLLTAFGIYRSRHPESKLKLACTGGLDNRRQALQEIATQMGLGDCVTITSYLPDVEFATLLRESRGLIFPSLFEGFGMPVLEAMAFNKPVLCSNVTSLPEVAGNAALLFDPRKPLEIAGAIEQLEGNPAMAGALVERGRQQLTTFADATGMAQQYWQVFQAVFTDGAYFTTAVHGIHSDGWTGDCLSVSHTTSGVPRYLELTLFAPEWLPHKTVKITLTGTGNDHTPCHTIPRGQTLIVRQRLQATGGLVRIQIRPVFQPQAYNLGSDSRYLGCLCRSCRILAPDKVEKLFRSK